MTEQPNEQDARRVIEALRTSHDHLVGVVAGFGDDGVTRPSYCTDWTIAQVLSHLGSGGQLALRVVDAGRRGEAPDQSGAQAVWDVWDAKTPSDQANDGLAVDEQMVERWEGLDENALQAFHTELFGMQLDAARAASMRLSEHLAHTWDIEVMQDPDATIRGDLAVLVGHWMQLLAGYTGKAANRSGGPIHWLIVTSDPERRFVLDVDADVQLQAAGSGDDDAAGRIDLPLEALMRLVYGRLDPAHTPSSVTTGGEARLDELRRIFPGL